MSINEINSWRGGVETYSLHSSWNNLVGKTALQQIGAFFVQVDSLNQY
jgi:hypothetical protein